MRLIVIVMVLSGGQALAQANFQSRGNGNWSSTSSWTRTSGTDADGIPDSNDNVVVQNGHRISINAGVNSDCFGLALNGSARIDITQANRSLNVYGTMTMNGTSRVVAGVAGTRQLNLLGAFIIPTGQTGTIDNVDLTQSVSQNFTILGELISSSTIGDKTIGNVFINSGGTSTGKWTFNAGETWTVRNFTIYDGPAGQALVDGSNTGTINVAGNLSVMATTAGQKSKFGEVNLTVTGTTYVAGSLSFTDNRGDKRFNNTVTVTNAGTWDNEVGEDPFINASIVNDGNWPQPIAESAIYTVETTGSFTYTGSLAINMSRLVITRATITNLTRLTLAGDPERGLQVDNPATFINGNGGYLTLLCTFDAIFQNGGGGIINFAAASNTVEYGQIGAQNIFATTYHKLICSNSGIKTQSPGTVTVNNELKLVGTATIYDAGPNTLNGAANLVMTGTSELHLKKNGVDLPELTGTANSLAPGTAISLHGSGAQTLKSSSIYAYQNVFVGGLTGSGALANLSNVTTILGDLTVIPAGAVTAIANDGLTVAGTFGSFQTGTTNISGGTGNLTVGNFMVDGGTFNYAGKTITINGNSGTWTNNGISNLTTDASSAVIFTTGTGQKIGGTSATTFNNLTIDNSNGVTLNTVSPTVAGVLDLKTGNLVTGTNRVIAPTVTRTSGFVQGNLQKPVATGTNVTIAYELGTGTAYAPVTLVFASVSSSGTGFVVGGTAGDHPQILSANIEPSSTVNRYYSMMRVGNVTFTTVSATLNFVAADIDAGFSPSVDAAIKGFDVESDIWKSAPVGVRTATSAQFINVPQANFPLNKQVDFQIGKRIIVSGFFNRLTGTLNWHAVTTWINNRDGNITLANGSAVVTGTGTLFGSQLIAGDQLVMQASPGAVPVTVQSITSNTSLLLTTPYTGTTTSGSFGRLRVPNTNGDSVVIGNPQLTGAADRATTIQLTANAMVHTLAINEPPNGRTTPQVLTHIATSQLSALNVSVNQPTGSTTDSWNINAGSAVVSGDLTIGSANINNTRIAQVVVTSGSLTIGGDLFFRTTGNGSQVTSVLTIGSGRINLAGTLQSIGNRCTLSMGPTATFNFNSAVVTQSLDLPDSSPGTFVFSNIECNNTSPGGVQLAKDLTRTNLTGNFRVLTGKFVLPAFGNPILSGGGSSTIEVANGATLEMLGNANFPSGFQTYTLGNTSTVIYGQTTNLDLPATPADYGHLTFSGNRNYTLNRVNVTVNGDLTIGNESNDPRVTGNGNNSLTVVGNVSIATGSSLDATAIQSILLGGNWTNNGTFTPGTGSNFVVFRGNGAVQPQIIGGTAPDTFYGMVLLTDDNTDIVQLSKDISISNQLLLTRGGLSINGNVLSVTDASTSAILRIGTGYIKSETTASPYSRLRRSINSATGSFVYPFGKSSVLTDYIPFTCQVISAGGSTGTFEVATYATAHNNTPFPEGVTNVNTGSDDSGNQVVDRFWILTRAGFTTTPVANLTFTVTAAEAAGVVGQLRAQRWTPANIWESAIPGQTNPTALSVTVPSVTSLSPWTLGTHLIPLPIEVLSFEARPSNGAVDLSWKTATEINNEFFDVERSRDGEEFVSIGRIPGSGNSHSVHSYAFTDTYPFAGNAYYRLRQTDYNGRVSYSWVLKVETSMTYSMMTWPNPSNGSEIAINWRDGEPGGLIFVRLWAQTGAKAFEGEISLDGDRNSRISFKKTLSPGIYILEAQTISGVQRMKVVVK